MLSEQIAAQADEDHRRIDQLGVEEQARAQPGKEQPAARGLLTDLQGQIDKPGQQQGLERFSVRAAGIDQAQRGKGEQQRQPNRQAGRGTVPLRQAGKQRDRHGHPQCRRKMRGKRKPRGLRQTGQPPQRFVGQVAWHLPERGPQGGKAVLFARALDKKVRGRVQGDRQLVAIDDRLRGLVRDVGISPRRLAAREQQKRAEQKHRQTGEHARRVTLLQPASLAA